MSMQHTPGPWIFYEDAPSIDPEWHIVTTANKLRVLANVHIDPTSPTDLANARLIAAAPDLLLAAEEAMRLIELLEIISGPDKEIYKHELRRDAEIFRARIAPTIAKATGAA